MEAKHIDVSAWKQVGEGGMGKTYAREDEPKVLLKLYNPGWGPSAELEYKLTRKVFELGVPSAEPYEFVTDGERLGMTLEKLVGKKSFYRMLSEDTSRLEEIAARFAAAAKELHSRTCDTECFESTAERYQAAILGVEGISERARDGICNILAKLERTNTCIHGDLHAGNIVDVAGRDVWIDLGEFGYGDPMLDLARTYVLSRMPEEKCLNDFHISSALNAEFYSRFAYHYYGPLSPAAEADLNRRLEALRMVQYGYLASLNKGVAQMLLPVLNGAFE